MFSVVLPGRSCLTDPTPIQPDPSTPPTNFAFTFSAAPKFSHIVVFLLPGITLPADTGAAVYIQFPSTNSNTQPEFKFLGAIANEKPSAIFKVSMPGSQRPTTEAEQEDEMMDVGAGGDSAAAGMGSLDPTATITLGIAVEPAQTIAPKLAALQSQTQAGTGADLVRRTGQAPSQMQKSGISTKLLAQRVIGNAFNFLASFAAADPRAQGEEVVPLKSFRDWWTKFERRLDADPGFLEREGDGV